MGTICSSGKVVVGVAESPGTKYAVSAHDRSRAGDDDGKPVRSRQRHRGAHRGASQPPDDDQRPLPVDAPVPDLPPVVTQVWQQDAAADNGGTGVSADPVVSDDYDAAPATLQFLPPMQSAMAVGRIVGHGRVVQGGQTRASHTYSPGALLSQDAANAARRTLRSQVSNTTDRSDFLTPVVRLNSPPLRMSTEFEPPSPHDAMTLHDDLSEAESPLTDSLAAGPSARRRTARNSRRATQRSQGNPLFGVPESAPLSEPESSPMAPSRRLLGVHDEPRGMRRSLDPSDVGGAAAAFSRLSARRTATTQSGASSGSAAASSTTNSSSSSSGPGATSAAAGLHAPAVATPKAAAAAAAAKDDDKWNSDSDEDDQSDGGAPAGLNTDKRRGGRGSAAHQPELLTLRNTSGIECDADILKEFYILQLVQSRPYSLLLRARHITTNTMYAIKVLLKDRAKAVLGDQQLWRLQNERKMLQVLRHPFIVNLSFDLESAKYLCLGLSWVQGRTLSYILDSEGRLRPRRARMYAAELLLALDYMHENSVVYRDLNTDNIMIGADGHVCLVDLGQAVRLSKNTKKRSTVVGDAGFKSPEMLQGKPYGFAADWWNFGVILFMMLAGRTPFETTFFWQTPDSLAKKGTKGATFPKNFPEDARDLIEKLLTKNPKLRIGKGSRHGAKEIQLHPFFAKINWLKTGAKRKKPEFAPDVMPLPVDEMPEFQNIEHVLDSLSPDAGSDASPS